VSIALKVDVDTLRGTLQGVPRLLRLFDRYRVRATFLFSLGPDHTGRALRRVFRRGFLAKVRRTSVMRHYGLRTLLYGTLLPGPHIGKRAGALMRTVAAAGHEVGIHCYDHVRWQDNVSGQDETWTRQEMVKAAAAFVEVFGRSAEVHGAAGWQLNPYTLSVEQELGFAYASDVRGHTPFYPVMQGLRSQCPQLPTTLPTLDELIGRAGIDEHNAAAHLFRESERSLPCGHVYTLHAELEGMNLLPVLDRLLKLWIAAQQNLLAMEDLIASLDLPHLPQHEIEFGQVAGRSGYLAVQGRQAEPFGGADGSR